MFFPRTSVLRAETMQRWRMKLKKEGGTAGSDLTPSEHKGIGNGDVHGMTHRIHYKFLVYHRHGSNCGDQANSTSSDCHQAEVSISLPVASTHIAPLS